MCTTLKSVCVFYPLFNDSGYVTRKASAMGSSKELVGYLKTYE